MAAVLFYVFSALAVVFTGMVVLLRNPVTSALSLVASFFCVSILFVLLHAPFLGVIQVLVYAGAILVLFLYLVMLLDLRQGEADTGSVTRVLRPALLGLVPAALILLVPTLRISNEPAGGVADSFGSMASVGRGLLGPYALPFEAISLVLLAGMIGVIVLAPQKKGERP